jgi:hypothetical protein
MEFTVTLTCDNDAFADDLRGETARILRRLADSVENGYDAGNLADVNGNTVGSFAFLPAVSA